jgi:hypothetical protein
MEQFKRMQQLAGLITEGMGAYEYEKGKEAGEKAEKKKMKKSELKKQIKEMILAEIESEEQLDEAKKKKKDEEEVEISATEEIPAGEETPITEPTSPSYDVQKELMDALNAAKSIGDEKLVRQIGNALTYFTRTQVAKEENPPAMKEGIEDYKISDEAYERMNSLVSQSDYNNYIKSASKMMSDLTDDGFEARDVFYWLYTRLTAEV